MPRSLLLEKKPKQMTYHKLENVKLIQRKEDNNTIIQGEHCIYVLEEIESFIWDNCNGVNTIGIIINKVVKKFHVNFCDNVIAEMINYINELEKEKLIELL